MIEIIIRKSLWLILLLGAAFFVLFPGCGEKAVKTVDSPTEVFKKFSRR